MNHPKTDRKQDVIDIITLPLYNGNTMSRPKTFSKCHPTLRNKGRGLCAKCYRQNRYWAVDKIVTTPYSEAVRVRKWGDKNLPKLLWRSANTRAKIKNLPFDITLEDITIPDTCPVLGIPLKRGVGLRIDSSPSLDRIDNKLGYVKGNIIVVSNRANQLKSNGTVEELRKIVDFYSALQKA